MLKKFFSSIILSFLLCNFIFTLPVFADSLTSSSSGKLFQIHCAGCHPNGNNIIRRGKNLKIKSLRRYGYDSVDAITQIVTNGKNNMSAFRERMTETEINQVANYVLQQAENNWK